MYEKLKMKLFSRTKMRILFIENAIDLFLLATNGMRFSEINYYGNAYCSLCRTISQWPLFNDRCMIFFRCHYSCLLDEKIEEKKIGSNNKKILYRTPI